jgi:hypothetical protein
MKKVSEVSEKNMKYLQDLMKKHGINSNPSEGPPKESRASKYGDPDKKVSRRRPEKSEGPPRKDSRKPRHRPPLKIDDDPDNISETSAISNISNVSVDQLDFIMKNSRKIFDKEKLESYESAAEINEFLDSTNRLIEWLKKPNCKTPKIFTNLLKKVFKNANVLSKYKNEVYDIINMMSVMREVINFLIGTPSASNGNKIIQQIESMISFINVANKTMIPNENIRNVTSIQQMFHACFNVENIFSVNNVMRFADSIINNNKKVIAIRGPQNSNLSTFLPFVNAIMIENERRRYPFVIIVAASTTDISSVSVKVRNMLRYAFIVTERQTFINYCSQKVLVRPVIGLFTPLHTLDILNTTTNNGIDIYQKARFCIENIGERTTEQDILLGKLKYCADSELPSHITLMSNSIIPHLLDFLGMSYNTINFGNESGYEINKKEVEILRSNTEKVVSEQIKEAVYFMADQEKEKRGNILVFVQTEVSANTIIRNATQLINTDNELFVFNGKDLSDIYDINDYTNKLITIVNENSQKKAHVLFINNSEMSNFANVVSSTKFKKLDSVIKVVIASKMNDDDVETENVSCVIDTGLSVIQTKNNDDLSFKCTSVIISEERAEKRMMRAAEAINGSYTRITFIDKTPPTEKIRPQIVRDDLSTSIINLRKIGIKLEKIDNLPNMPDRENVTETINVLKANNVLDDMGSLSKKGEKISKFESFSPVFSMAITNIAEKEFPENPDIAKCLGALIVSIITSRSIVRSNYCDIFYNNFCPSSDIVTIVKSMIRIISDNKDFKNNDSLWSQNCFVVSSVMSILLCIEKLFVSLFGESDDENFYATKWAEFIDFANKVDIFDFTTLIIQEIIKAKPMWEKKHAAKYVSVRTTNNQGYLFSFINKLEEKITDIQRLGSRGIFIPGELYVINIVGEKGSLIHGFSKEIMFEPNIPCSIYNNKFSNNIFFRTLTKIYINEISEHLEPLKVITNIFDKSAEYKEFVIFNDTDEGVFVSFIAKTAAALDIINNGLKEIDALMPYVGKSIIIHNDYPNSAIEVISNGAMRSYFTYVHLIEKDSLVLPRAYSVNKNVIDFLYKKINELASDMNQYRIALTGEALVFSLNDDHTENSINTISTLSSPYIFGRKSRLILLISREVEQPSEPELTWISPSLVNEDELTQATSALARNIIHAKHNRDMFVIKGSPEFKYKGSKKTEIAINQLYRTTNSTIQQVIQTLFDNFTNGSALTSENIEMNDFVFVENGNQPTSTLFYKIQELRSKKIGLGIPKLQKRKDQITEILKSKPKNLQELQKELAGIDAKIKESKSLDNSIAALEKQEKESIFFKKSNEMKNHIVGTQENAGSVFPFFGTYAFKSNEIIPKESIDAKSESILQVARRCNIPAFSVEHLPIISIFVENNYSLNLSHAEFEERVKKTCRRFSFIISSITNLFFKKQNVPKSPKGNKPPPPPPPYMIVEVFGSSFAFVVAHEILHALKGETQSVFVIPRNILSPMMINNSENIKVIKKWFADNKLETIKRKGINFSGSKADVERANALVKDPKTTIPFRFVPLSIPPGVDLKTLGYIVNQHNKEVDSANRWVLDATCHQLITTVEDKDNAASIMREIGTTKIKEDNDAICFGMCEETILSSMPIIEYAKDGSITKSHICRDCISDFLDSLIDKFYDGVSINFDAIMTLTDALNSIALTSNENTVSGETWPKIPPGQLLWNLVHDPNFTDKAKAWLTGVSSQALHNNRNIITFCPEHPGIFLPVKRGREDMKCSVKTCSMIKCGTCGEWHHQGDCKNYEYKGMRCPRCGKPTFKDSGCNHITCPCGAHWCYKCGDVAYNTGSEVYQHMTKAHGDWYN